jgi:uncharacterized protein
MKTIMIAAVVLVLAARAGARDVAPPAWTREPLAFDVLQFHVEGDLLLPPGNGVFPVVVYVWGAGPTHREGTISSSPVLQEMLATGYAVYVHDKPGSGGSTGDFTRGRLFRERATITAAALDRLAEHPRVDSARLGLYGSSQAAYVLPYVLASSDRVAFVVCWSCPMEDSVEQGAFLVENLVRCAGRPEATALEAGARYRSRALAADYAAYREAAAWLDSLPEVRDELGWGGVRDEAAWMPQTPDAESFVDPGRSFPPLDLPTLVVYGSRDRNVDPVQGQARFRELLRKGAAEGQRIVVVEGADHNMRLTPDGCIQHQLRNYRDLPEAVLAPAFLAAVGDWLRALPALAD